MRRALLVFSFSLLRVLAWPDIAFADEANDRDTLFATGVTALQQGHANEAIAQFEALADRGVVDASASFDRGLAYATRVRISGGESGDLGRAVHGFEEARALATNARTSEEATRALGIVRGEIARRRGRSGEPLDLEPDVPLGRAIARALPENFWSVFVIVSSWTLAIGIAVRAFAKARRGRLAGLVASGVAIVVGLSAFVLLAMARHDRLHVREAIVVVPGARPVDERGVTIQGASPIPEGAHLRVTDSRAGLHHVHWRKGDTWLSNTAVRLLATSAPD